MSLQETREVCMSKVGLVVVQQTLARTSQGLEKLFDGRVLDSAWWSSLQEGGYVRVEVESRGVRP